MRIKMTREEFEKWCRENGTGHKVNKSCNGIDWALVTMKDGWIAIFEYDYCAGYYPKIQAKDEAHALSYIAMIERPRVALQRI